MAKALDRVLKDLNLPNYLEVLSHRLRLENISPDELEGIGLRTSSPVVISSVSPVEEPSMAGKVDDLKPIAPSTSQTPAQQSLLQAQQEFAELDIHEDLLKKIFAYNYLSCDG